MGALVAERDESRCNYASTRFLTWSLAVGAALNCEGGKSSLPKPCATYPVIHRCWPRTGFDSFLELAIRVFGYQVGSGLPVGKVTGNGLRP